MRSLRHATPAALALLGAMLLGACASAGPSGTPAPETGAFVVRLGADTTAVERWTRTPDAAGGARVEGDLLTRTPAVRLVHYALVLDARQLPREVTVQYRQPDGRPVTTGVIGVRTTFANDSAVAQLQRPESTTTVRAASIPTGAVLSFGQSYAVWETVLRALRAAGRDSGAIALWAPGARTPQTLPVRLFGDSARVTYFGDPVLVRLDRAGRIVAVDGSRTTNKVLVERLADPRRLDVGALARDLAARPAMGAPSPTDTVRATVGRAQVAIVYSRPSVRGRSVWGGTLVPYGQIWRTGANAATTLRTSADLTIGGQRVPAGTYTLFTFPTAERTQLVINRQTGQWGTEYKPDMDLVRVPLTVTPLAPPTEQFTIAVERGMLVLRWGDRQLATAIAAR